MCVVLGSGTRAIIENDVVILLIVVDGKGGMLSLYQDINSWTPLPIPTFITDETDLEGFDGRVHFIARTRIPDTQCWPFAPVDDNILEGTRNLMVMINSTALPPFVTAIAPDSLNVTITDDECKIFRNELPIF